MFEVIFAKSVYKDIKKITPKALPQIKTSIEALKHFPNLSQIKSLQNHPIAHYRLRVGNYRVLFDVDWDHSKIHILKIGHRKSVY